MKLHHSAALAVALAAALAAPAHAGKLSVTREATIDSSPATVWKYVGDFNALDVWHPAVKNSTVKGKVRTLDLGGGATITEKMTAYSAAKTSYSYDILTSPLPVQNYHSTITLSPADGGKTLMKWTSTFEAKGAPDEKAVEVITGIYDGGLGKVSANFKK